MPSSTGTAPTSSPPTRASLKAWWRQFTFLQRINTKKEPAPQLTNPSLRVSTESSIFGKPLRDSLRYASVHISTATANGDLCVWGYIPVVVAKCGLFLKENGTEVTGTFRVSGSNRRMKDLQALFDTPPKYGKDINWNKWQFTTHDVASVFRRYLTMMPEPIIPHDRYHDFRDILAQDPPLSEEDKIKAYKKAIQSLPPANQYLLLYVLDLLSVFARKADRNLMNAENLATIFRPGVINHPTDEMNPSQHRLSQQVLEFLIAQQDWFMTDVPPPPRRDSIMVGAEASGTAQHVLMLPTTEEDDPAEGSWKIVEPVNTTTGIDRRHTTASRQPIPTDLTDGVSTNAVLSEHGESAPLFRKVSIELPPPRISTECGDRTLGVGAATVKRSTTAPSRSGSVRARDVNALVLSVEGGRAGLTESPQPSEKESMSGQVHTKAGHDSKFSSTTD